MYGTALLDAWWSNTNHSCDESESTELNGIVIIIMKVYRQYVL